MLVFLGRQADFNLSEYSRKGQWNTRTKLPGIPWFITYDNYLANSTTRGSCGRDLSLPTTAGETMVFICHTISLSFDGEILNASIRRNKTTSGEVTFRSAARLRFMDINSLISSWENLKPLRVKKVRSAIYTLAENIVHARSSSSNKCHPRREY